jgi:hypothetical protein
MSENEVMMSETAWREWLKKWSSDVIEADDALLT